MTLSLTRRGILRCLVSTIAAPAVVRADALMRIVPPPKTGIVFDQFGNAFESYTSDFRWITPPMLVSRDWRYVAAIANIEPGQIHRAPPGVFSLLPASPSAHHGAEGAVAAGQLRFG